MKHKSVCRRLHIFLQTKSSLRLLAITASTIVFMWHAKGTITKNHSLRTRTASIQKPFSNVREARTVISPGHDVTLTRALTPEERIRRLELKLDSWMNWANDPRFGFRVTSRCEQISKLDEFGCAAGKDKCPGLYSHAICMDHFKPSDVPTDCLIYDFGIRQQPEFSVVMHDYFGCEVHGFDPSPVTLEWIQTSEMMNKTRFHFHPYGAGGVDGPVDLYKYDWGQVSIIRNVESQDKQETFPLPVKTLATIMKELGHTDRTLDVIKVDIEGSEYQFLEEALDTLGTLPTKQLTVEWHHYAFDPRYGGGSSPQINALVTLLHESGLKQFWRHSDAGWLSEISKEHWEKVGLDNVRYNLASFHHED